MHLADAVIEGIGYIIAGIIQSKTRLILLKIVFILQPLIQMEAALCVGIDLLQQQKIGILFQGSALFDFRTVLGNIMFPMDFLTDWSESEKKERARYLLDKVNVKDSEDKYPDELSGGMQKRVGIARAIALNPSYLFCDEPNSGLDPETAIVIDKLISSITKEFGITTVMNTHDLNSILEIGDNIGYLYKGTILWEGDRHSIMNSGCEQLEEFLCSNMLARSIIQQNKKKVDI